MCTSSRLVTVLITTLKLASAFRAPSVSEELGCSPTLSMLLGRPDGSFYFDPLQIANDQNFARLRECELKHGRVAMAANLGLELPPLWKQLAEQQKWELEELPGSVSIVDNILRLEAVDYLNILVTCGFLESFIFIQQDPTDMPGDYGTGYFFVRDKGLHERSLISELENGRLAMLALTIQLVAELATGKDYLEHWQLAFEQVAEKTQGYIQN